MQESDPTHQPRPEGSAPAAAEVSRVPAGVTVTTPPGPPTGPVAAPASPPTNTMAVMSLVAGVAGYVLPHPFIAGLIAIYAGHTARRQIRQTGEAGASLALVGLILGYVHLALSILVLVLILFVVIGLGALIASSGQR